MTYQTHNFEQRSDAWHKFRSVHLGASEAPIMLGLSPYKTRSQLLHEKHTGIIAEVDADTQYRFDKGHRFEALARPLAEKIIGQELAPITISEGKLSASLDGITIDDSIIWEHKTLNNELRALFSSSTTVEIPEFYAAQLEQQLMLSGADYCIFMASSWDDANNLLEEYHGAYEPNMGMRNRILQGWAQFEKDLAEHKPQEYIHAPKADVKIELPALFVHARGEITEHNMEAFGLALTAKLTEVRAIALITDLDFSNAKEAAKKFRETAKEIMLSEAAMLAQTETIGEASRKMKAWVKDLNATALQLEKDVEREDLAKKRVMVGDAQTAFRAHIEALEAETRPIRLNVERPNFAEAIKSKRNYASMQGALDDALANGKIAADAIARETRLRLAWFNDAAKGYEFLFPDLQQIIFV